MARTARSQQLKRLLPARALVSCALPHARGRHDRASEESRAQHVHPSDNVIPGASQPLLRRNSRLRPASLEKEQRIARVLSIEKQILCQDSLCSMVS